VHGFKAAILEPEHADLYNGGHDCSGRSNINIEQLKGNEENQKREKIDQEFHAL